MALLKRKDLQIWLMWFTIVAAAMVIMAIAVH